jgi:hypothetical protein
VELWNRQLDVGMYVHWAARSELTLCGSDNSCMHGPLHSSRQLVTRITKVKRCISEVRHDCSVPAVPHNGLKTGVKPAERRLSIISN